MKHKFLVITLAAAVCLTGCASKPSLVGTWQASSAASGSSQGFSATMQYTFRPDNTITTTTHQSIGPIGTTDSQSGTYVVSGNVVTITPTSRTMALDPATRSALIQRMQQLHPGFAMPAQNGAPSSVPVNHTPVQYTWNLKDSNTLDLESTAANPAGSRLIEFTRSAP